jgi:hypothetical protein
MDDIEYQMTEWFPKKVKPVHVGQYMIKTAGKNSWEHRGLWTGTNWVNSWCEPQDYNDLEKLIKIREWRGLAVDPDSGVSFEDKTDLEAALVELKAEFERLIAVDAECVQCDWTGAIDDTNDVEGQMVCPECQEPIEILEEKS